MAREATIRLGMLLDSMGRLDEAERWYRLSETNVDAGTGEHWNIFGGDEPGCCGRVTRWT